MDIAASPAEVVGLVAAVIVAGAVSGLLAGLFGIGGGAVIVPVLYQGLSILGVDDAVRMHVSLGTSVAIIVPTSIRSFMAHYRRGAVDMELLKGWLIAVPLGAIAASVVAGLLSGTALRAVFTVLVTLFGIRFLLNREGWSLGETLPGNPARTAVGVGIGFISTLMGIGGGVLNTTFMTLYGRPMHQAVATSSGVGVLISLPALFGYAWAGWGAAGLPPFSIGFVNFVALALVIPVSVLVAPVGVRLAHAISKRRLEMAFGVFLIFVAARFALTLL